MYTSKQFRVRSFEVLKPEIRKLAEAYRGVKKVFIADGNAFVLSAKKMLPVLDEINAQFGKLQRISAYALPKDIQNKTEEELKEIRKRGLKLLYIGIESGDDELLRLSNKGETFNSTVDGIQKAHKAGIDTSIMIINGLGGRKYSKQHALHSAEIINQVQPKFLSTLTLSTPFGLEHFQQKFEGNYEEQSVQELIEELRTFIEHLTTESTIYRSDHVSNNLVLKGTLSKDKERLLQEIDRTLMER
jgi:radical SAM superfamily enzyme YgiQ (UPF0313 family)